ncbi:MAG TPA: radical SAM protein [Candidatus Kapabacteria bacterium]|nr:radical SAM protein [Candidatus Kapabacteria bacterium]
MTSADGYPTGTVERARWVLDRRGTKNAVRADRAYAQILEQEPLEDGTIADVATIFLTNRECPWKCVMCDLWRNTASAPAGSVPAQIARALEELPGSRKATVLKLYNSGSFFDVGAIPRSDWSAIAELCGPFDRVIVECHPRLVTPAVLEFADMLSASLEVAMGLETAHRDALEKINKRITVDDFRRAADFLRTNEISVRTFLLVGVPFIMTKEQFHWLKRSVEFAFNAGTNVISLIPTRSGNGGLDELQSRGEFYEPTLSELEAAHEFGLGLNAGRVFADTWDIERFSGCTICAGARAMRIATMNLNQRILPRVECTCGE